MPNNDFNPQDSYYNERLRQAHIAFNFTLWAAVTSAVVALVGMVLMLCGNWPTGLPIAALGTMSGIVNNPFYKMDKEANDRLDKAVREK